MPKPKSVTLGGTQESNLWNALTLAAQEYDKNAKQFREWEAEWKAFTPEQQAEKRASYGFINPDALGSLAHQFETNAETTRELVDVLQGDDDASSVEITVTSYFH